MQILTVGFKNRTDKHYVEPKNGVIVQTAFESWLKDGKNRLGRFDAFVLVNGQMGPVYPVTIDFADVNALFTSNFPS